MAERGVIRVVKDREVRRVAQQHVALEHVLVKRVDAPPDTRVGLRPRARLEVHVCTEQVDLGAPPPHGEGRAARSLLEAHVATVFEALDLAPQS